jgi:predicted AlkP superfamily pyrophosphatase or phosphodiesterase
MHYWGPLASAKSSDWIADATAALITDSYRQPDLCFTYLPVLDYDLQRHGPDSAKAHKALETLFAELEVLMEACRNCHFDMLVYGDYAISPVTNGAVFPNRALSQAGLFTCREVKGMHYPDYYSSGAFAVADHEIAHVYVKDLQAEKKAVEVLDKLEGVGEILDRQKQAYAGISHERSGDLVLVAEDGYWFSYPWWEKERQAPEYASHVDIHNKPGYHPCELFFGWPPFSVSRDTGKIKGSHGKVGKGRQTCWASTCSFPNQPASLMELSSAVRNWLEETDA